MPDRPGRCRTGARDFAAGLAGWVPLAPVHIRLADRFVPEELIVRSGRPAAPARPAFTFHATD